MTPAHLRPQDFAARDAHRPKIQALRALYLVKKTGADMAPVHLSACALEWGALSAQVKAVIVLLAGVDDDAGLARLRDWREFAPTERSAMRWVMVELRTSVAGMASLLVPEL